MPSSSETCPEAPDFNSTIYVLGCVSSKRKGKHPAKDLYSSDLFAKERLYIELLERKFGHKLRWFILSAEYGLLHPDEVIESYDRVMTPTRAKEMTEGDSSRKKWKELVGKPYPKSIVCLCGRNYRCFLENVFAGVRIVNFYSDQDGKPLGIGMIKSKLKKILQAANDAVPSIF